MKFGTKLKLGRFRMHAGERMVCQPLARIGKPTGNSKRRRRRR